MSRHRTRRESGLGTKRIKKGLTGPFKIFFGLNLLDPELRRDLRLHLYLPESNDLVGRPPPSATLAVAPPLSPETVPPIWGVTHGK